MASARSCSATMSGRRVATQCRSFVMMLSSGNTTRAIALDKLPVLIQFCS